MGREGGKKKKRGGKGEEKGGKGKKKLENQRQGFSQLFRPPAICAAVQ